MHPFAILGTKVLRLISRAQMFCWRQDLFQSTIIVHNIYRPQTKFAKVMFSQVSVCPQWGEYLGRYPSWAGTPQAGTSSGQVQPPRAGTPPGQVPPQTGTPRSRYTTPRQVHPPGTVHTGIRSTRGPYASHGECILVSVCCLSTIHILLIIKSQTCGRNCQSSFL